MRVKLVHWSTQADFIQKRSVDKLYIPDGYNPQKMYHFRSSHAGLTKLTHIIDDEEDDFAWGHSEYDAREQTKPSTLGPTNTWANHMAVKTAKISKKLL